MLIKCQRTITIKVFLGLFKIFSHLFLTYFIDIQIFILKFTELLNEETDNLDISCIPNALVLIKPVFDNGPGGYGYEKIGGKCMFFSPLHNIRMGAPPTLILLGTEDQNIPAITGEYFNSAMQKAGNKCELILFEGVGHELFHSDKSPESYKKGLVDIQNILISLGYLSKAHGAEDTK